MTSDVVEVMYRGSVESIDYFQEQNVFITGKRKRITLKLSTSLNLLVNEN